jgi:hypothetical protein
MLYHYWPILSQIRSVQQHKTVFAIVMFYNMRNYIFYCCNFQMFLLKAQNPAKSNQVHTTIEIKISDCRPTIAKTVLYCCTDLIWLFQIFLLTCTLSLRNLQKRKSSRVKKQLCRIITSNFQHDNFLNNFLSIRRESQI